ncbi:uncharacterized protein LOC132068334 [Lycium ferocissimum]|uniref:uncharacterized protein LOC132068334 n=1 Tax=Lycium ferocissimum TaxID=112874 RepID=UPI00281554C8|nr:uncharacterized protein LOC132068334 [Lycium ferocissimum]
MLLEEFEDDAIASHESQQLIIDSQKNIQNEKKKSSTIWTAARLISLQDIEKYYGKKNREEAAESLEVSVSTFKRLCRKYGIRRWPTAKRKKDGCLISARRCNASIAELRTSQPPQNGVPREDRDTIFISMQKRKRREIEEDNVDANNHRELQPFEIQNCTSKRQALDCATKDSSCLKSINWTIEGVNKDQSPNSESINGNVMDGMDFTRIGVQPSLESTSIQQLNSLSCNENTAQSAKLLFNNLIALPLKDLTDPENEASMKETLSILADNHLLFSEEQAKRIVELKLEFTSLVHSWREYSRSQMHSQKFFTDLEKTRIMEATSAKDEECLKIRYEELQSKKEELMAQLEAVQKEQDGVAEQRRENFKQSKHLVSLAEERASRTKEKHLVMTITSAKLNNLVDQWAAIQSLFMQIG